jgi:PTH1 family peptidyl-tRNA hydrolase
LAGSIFLIVGLGNPGKEYEGTRHNLGFEVVSKLAKECGFAFRREKELEGAVARGRFHENELILLKPLTFMNESGVSVLAALRAFKVELSNLLVVVDDVAIDFGSLRMRKQGSSGGHNGLKSIEAHLATQDFARLRVGIGPDFGDDLADYVLAKFSEEEKEKLPEILEEATKSVVQWIKHAVEGKSPSNPSIGE